MEEGDCMDARDGTIVLPSRGAATLWSLIHAGAYRYVDADLTDDRFGADHPRVRPAVATRVEFGALPDGEAAVRQVLATGCHPVTCIELLEACAACKDMPADGLLMALGTVWTDTRGPGAPRRYAAAVVAAFGSRRLELMRLDHVWRESYRTLVIADVAPP